MVLNSSLADGQISFDVIDGEPYVKVGADTLRPFKNKIEGITSNVMVDNGTISETLDYLPENPTIITYTCDKDGNLIGDLDVSGAIRLHISDSIQYTFTLDFKHFGTKSNVYVNGNTITFNYSSAYEINKFLHYIIF